MMTAYERLQAARAKTVRLPERILNSFSQNVQNCMVTESMPMIRQLLTYW